MMVVIVVELVLLTNIKVVELWLCRIVRVGNHLVHVRIILIHIHLFIYIVYFIPEVHFIVPQIFFVFHKA